MTLAGPNTCCAAKTAGYPDIAGGLAKALLAGADVGMAVSTVYKKGFDQIGAIVDGLATWLEKKGYDSVAKIKGMLSQQNCPDPAAFERGNYMKTLGSWARPWRTV